MKSLPSFARNWNPPKPSLVPNFPILAVSFEKSSAKAAKEAETLREEIDNLIVIVQGCLAVPYQFEKSQQC